MTMAQAPVANVPPADLLKSFIERSLAEPASHHPSLEGLAPSLRQASADIDANIGNAERTPEFERAKKAAGAADARHDMRHGFNYELLGAFTRHEQDAVRAAA